MDGTAVFQPWFPNRNDLLGIASTVPFMETMTIAQTARHLGLSDQGVRKMIGRAELGVLPGSDPIRLDAEHVETVRLLRRESLLLDLASKRQTPVTLAREARRILFPTVPGVNLPQDRGEDQRRRLSLVSSEARQLFGVASLTAACVQDACRWCTARKFAEVLGGWVPDSYSEGFAELFAQQPCARCGPSLYGSVLAALAARVHPGGERPSAARTAPSAAERQRATEWVRQRAVTASAEPIQRDDNGRALVQRRLREERAKLKAAERAGDQRSALRLAQVVRDLEQDAVRVDGGAVTASARPGRLACGHALAAGCSCPRRASKRGQQ